MTGPADNLVLDNVTKRFPGSDGAELTVLNGVSCVVEAGEAVAIVGPSGSGKSTLLNIIGALDKPTSGTVRLGDTDVTALAGRELASFRALRVGFVFQEHHLLPQLSALENVLLPTLAIDRRDACPTRVPRLTGVPCTQSGAEGPVNREQRAEGLLERVGLTERQDAFPAQLSGGERQRVALARALINGAKLLLCDEPTGNLDRQTGASAVSLLLELASQQGVTVLMVTHNVEQAARFGRCLELLDGKLSPLTNPETAGGQQ